jgi:transcriptional regulator GlxA family with amidase domain
MADAMAGTGGQSRLLVEQLQTVIQTHIILTYGDEAQLTSRRIADEVKLLESERVKLLDYIDANLDGRLRIGHMAELTGRTSHQLVDACYDAFGMSPSRVVMEQRLRRARELLASSRATITAIAVATGFSNHSHFIRAFQQHYSMTPTQFRAEQTYFADERNCMKSGLVG